jgi:hypothetical protein
VAAVMIAGWLWRLEVSLPAEASYRDYRPFAAEVRRHAPAPAEVAFFRAEAHALSFRVGRPLARFVQWNELRDRLSEPGAHYLVLPPDCAAEAPRHLPGARIVELCRTTTLAGGRHERPLVLLRAEHTCGAGVSPAKRSRRDACTTTPAPQHEGRAHAPATDPAARREGAAQRRPARQ